MNEQTPVSETRCIQVWEMIEQEIRLKEIGPSSIPVKTLMSWTIGKGSVEPAEFVAAAEWASDKGYITAGTKGGPGSLGYVILTSAGHDNAVS